MTYAIFANSKKIIQKSVLEYLRLYHSQYFPLIEKNKIYKQVSDNLFLLRAGKHSSPSDILGYTTQGLSLSKRDILYCIPIDEKLSDRISEKTNNQFGYIYNRHLNKLDDIDISYLELEYNVTDCLYYLAHYLYMLESKNKMDKSHKDYVLVDNYSQWQSEEKYSDVGTIDRNNLGKRNQKLVYSRFSYSDFIQNEVFPGLPLKQALKILGFRIKFRIKNKLYDTVDEKTFNSIDELVNLVFVGYKDWKEKIKIDIDLNFYNNKKMGTMGGEAKMIYEKPRYSFLN